jgi:hypothetical protein
MAIGTEILFHLPGIGINPALIVFRIAGEAEDDAKQLNPGIYRNFKRQFGGGGRSPGGSWSVSLLTGIENRIAEAYKQATKDNRCPQPSKFSHGLSLPHSLSFKMII